MTSMVYPTAQAVEERPGTPVVSKEVSLEHRGPHLWGIFGLMVVVTAFWAWTLQNTIFIDESVYIMAGRDYLNHWFNGVPLPANVGEGFSGLPFMYPVLAGAIDMVGGLAAVRAFSLVCIIGTMFLVRGITNYAFNRRAGLIAAGVFGLTGPVLYVGHLGTFDAVVILMLAGALYLGLCRTGFLSAIGMGALLALAVATKYTAYVFVPPILVLSLFGQYPLAMSMSFRYWITHPRLDVRRVIRAVIAGIVMAGVIYAGWLLVGEQIQAALEFTTTGRQALSPAPVDYLVRLLPTHLWLVYLAALTGMIWLIHSRRWTAVLFGVGLIGTSLLLPVAQMILGEAVSFEKHLAYSALFLAPLVGWGLGRPWRLAVWAPVLVWVLAITTLWGAWRSHDLIMYPNVTSVVQSLEAEAKPGLYLSSSADSLRYYTRDNPSIQWETTFALYGDGSDYTPLVNAVTEGHYQEIIIHAGPTGSTLQDKGQRTLLVALDSSPRYKMTTLDDGEWLVYTKEVI